MSFPQFFNDAPVIRVMDPLARLLGAPADGIIEYHYVDAVRLAGHSCPTVAGAFLTARAGLRALYGEDLPDRGGVTIAMPAAEEEGVTGVIAQVVTLVTGATTDNGFKGIGGRFSRNGLMAFAPGGGVGTAGVRFRRRDNGAAVDVEFSPDSVPASPSQKRLLMEVLQGGGDAATQAAFAEAWQERVRRLLLEHADDPEVVRITDIRSETA